MVRGESPDGDQVSLSPVDEIVACTGFRPELGLLREQWRRDDTERRDTGKRSKHSDFGVRGSA